MKGSMNKETQQGDVGRKSIWLWMAGWMSAILALFIYPYIFGVVGVITGVITSKRGSRAGLSLIVVSMIFMSIGLIYSRIIFNFARKLLGI